MRDQDQTARIPGFVPGYVPRHRLLNRLDAVADSRLIFVLAPTGGGKTSLVADWARQRSAHEFVAGADLAGGLETKQAFWEAVGRVIAPTTGDAPHTAADVLTALIGEDESFTLVVHDFRRAASAVRPDSLKLAQNVERSTRVRHTMVGACPDLRECGRARHRSGTHGGHLRRAVDVSQRLSRRYS